MGPDIARGWIVANLISLVVGAFVALTDYFARRTLGVTDPATGWATISAYVALAMLLSAVSAAVYARLTAAVLAFVVAAFPYSSWLSVHLAIGAVFGAIVGVAALTPVSEEPIQWGSVAEAIFLFCVFSIGGALLGFAVGGLQALVLRGTVRGLKLWMCLSALAGCCTGALVAAFAIWIPEQSGFSSEIALQGIISVSGVVTAVVMLPAVMRLKPLT